MVNSGSADMYDDYQTDLEYLKYKLANWQESLPSTRDYDFAVRFLIKETIIESEVRGRYYGR
jgi:hypothetical protein